VAASHGVEDVLYLEVKPNGYFKNNDECITIYKNV